MKNVFLPLLSYFQCFIGAFRSDPVLSDTTNPSTKRSNARIDYESEENIEDNFTGIDTSDQSNFISSI